MKKKQPADAVTVAADWKDTVGLIDEFKAALAHFGLTVVEHPDFEGSDTYGFIVSNRPLTRNELKAFLNPINDQGEGNGGVMTEAKTTKDALRHEHMEIETEEVNDCLQRLVDLAIAHDERNGGERCEEFRTRVAASLMYAFEMRLFEIGFVAEDLLDRYDEGVHAASAGH